MQIQSKKTSMRRTFSRIKGFWQRYKRNRAAVFGLIVVCIIIFLAVSAPFLATYDPGKVGLAHLKPPGSQFLLGTDEIGRDVYSRVLYGGRVSLVVGIFAALTSTIIGTIVGSISGFYGGIIDDIMVRVAESFQVIPTFFLALMVAFFLGPSIGYIIFVIGILSWPSTFRLVRAEFLSLKEREFVEAAKAVGVSEKRIVFEEILPNATPPIIVNASLQMAAAILIEAALSFFGLGDPAWVSWGRMLFEAQKILRVAWWVTVFPGLAIFFTVLGLNLMGDGLNDALNPRLRER